MKESFLHLDIQHRIGLFHLIRSSKPIQFTAGSLHAEWP